MTAWTPGDGDREVVSLGPDSNPRSPGGRLIGVAAICLVVGFLAGGRTGLVGGQAPADGAVGSSVSVGAVERVPQANLGSEFELPVFNAGEQEIEASLVALADVGPQLGSTSTTRVLPGEWSAVLFRPPDCHELLPDQIGTVRLHVLTAAGEHDEVVALPDEGRSLVAYHLDVCAPAFPVQRSKLYGVWLLEEVYGNWTGLEGVHLMRFDPDGTFVADPEGGLFTGDVGVSGRYRVHRLLTMDVDGGYGCKPLPVTARWKAKIRVDGRLSLAWVGGGCPVEPGGLWVLRKVLDDAGLPAWPPAARSGAPAG